MSDATTAPERATERGRRKVRVGKVVSDAMQKTIVVRVEQFVRHRLYKRVLKRYGGLKAHDERNEAKVGDWVKIVETRPLSKDKRWRLVEVVKRTSSAPAVPEAQSEVAGRAAMAARAAEKMASIQESAPAQESAG